MSNKVFSPSSMTTESKAPRAGSATADVPAPATFSGAATPPQTAKRWLGIRVRRDWVFRRLLMLADVVSAGAGLAVVALLGGGGIPTVSFLTLPLIIVFAKMTGRYERDELVLRKSTLEELPGLLCVAGANALAWSVITYLAGFRSTLQDAGVAVLCGSTAIGLVLTRSAARRLAQLTAPVERVLIVGGSAARQLLASSLATDPAARLAVVGFLPLEDERRVDNDWGSRSRRQRARSFDDLEVVVRELEVTRVFLIPSHADGELMLEAVRRTAALGIRVSIVPRLFEVVGSAVAFDSVGGVTVLGIRPPRLSRFSLLTKRLMDLIGAVGCLLMLTPLMAIVAILIKLDSPGPVFFRQRRVGRDGETFGILKFRSMIDGAEAERAALDALNETSGNFKLAADPRVTRVGRLLRRTSIDELPQLINVLKGDMSLVGPRPLVIAEDRLVEGRHRDRLHLAPGITGPWQVLGPSRPPLSEMVKTDYLYALNWSIWADIKLLLRTLSHVAARRGR